MSTTKGILHLVVQKGKNMTTSMNLQDYVLVYCACPDSVSQQIRISVTTFKSRNSIPQLAHTVHSKSTSYHAFYECMHKIKHFELPHSYKPETKIQQGNKDRFCHFLITSYYNMIDCTLLNQRYIEYKKYLKHSLSYLSLCKI